MRIHYFYGLSCLDHAPVLSSFLNSVLSRTYALACSQYTWSAPMLTSSNVIFPILPTHLKPALLSSGRLEYTQGHQLLTFVRFPSFTYCFTTPFLSTPQISLPCFFPPSTLNACRWHETGYNIDQATFVSDVTDSDDCQSI